MSIANHKQSALILSTGTDRPEQKMHKNKDTLKVHKNNYIL